MADYSLEILASMGEIDPAEWDALIDNASRPLLSHAFLKLLETSGSICPATGWTPAHFLLRRDRPSGPGGTGRLIAAAPFYLRDDSWGDFVFDQEFARAAEAAGRAWYPKLVGAVPVTPAPAWRVLTAPGEDGPALGELILQGARDAAKEAGLGGVHILWPAPAQAAALRKRAKAGPEDWVEWPHQAFLWKNRGWADFPAWLSSFSKNMRRNVLRERKALAEAGISTRVLGPAEAAARPGLIEAFSQLYESHNDKFGPWAAKFLTPDFFLGLPEAMASGWALSVGFRGDEVLAMAFLLEGPDRLYGRYYGAREEVPGLHFELCYYRPVEYALEKGISSFDPGMGSPHKARRGFASLLAPSFHLPLDPDLRAMMARYMPQIAQAEAAQVEELNRDLPYKATASPGPGGA